MILPAQHIRARTGLITPFAERSKAHGMTFGLSCAGYDVRIAQTVFLAPGDFKLASTVEHFDMPLDLIGHVADKSTWARRGLAVQNTILECGWRGYLTIELSNHSRQTIYIEEGSPIAQIVFHLLLEPTEQPYGGKYQSQPARPVAAILEGE
jgi:dCTP deaminase